MANWTLQYGPRRYPLGAAPLVLGRGDDADVSIQDASVSRRHALVYVGADGPVIEDIGSRHGLMVDGQRVDSRGRMDLRHNARIAIGPHQILVQEVARLKLEHAATLERSRRDVVGTTVPGDTSATGDVDPLVGLMNDVEASILLGPASKTASLIHALLVNLKNRSASLDEATLHRAASIVLRVAASTERAQW